MKTLQETKEFVANKITNKFISWDKVLSDYEFGTGISKLISYEDLMDRVAEEYKEQFIPKKELVDLRKSIHSADTSGEELVIKDLAKQCDNILKKLGIKVKIKYVNPFHK